MAMADDVVLRYVGRGEYIHGVPGRDLTAEDVAKLSPRQFDQVCGSFLYIGEVVPPPLPVAEAVPNDEDEDTGE
jgi:hypothetical protein